MCFECGADVGTDHGGVVLCGMLDFTLLMCGYVVLLSCSQCPVVM
jgi:hypothetical protein